MKCHQKVDKFNKKTKFYLSGTPGHGNPYRANVAAEGRIHLADAHRGGHH
jgi:hypothetical protein